MVIPAAIASSAYVGYWTAASSQVLSPVMRRKIAPAVTIPTAMAASISKKCRQKGRIRLWLATRGPGCRFPRGSAQPPRCEILLMRWWVA